MADAELPDALATLVRLSPVPTVIVGHSNRVVCANESLGHLLTHAPDALRDIPFEDLFSEAGRAPVYRWCEQWSRNSDEETFNGFESTLAVRGQRLQVTVTARTVVIGNSRWAAVAIVPVPDTRSNDLRFELAVEASPTGMLLTDSQGRILLVNTEIERLLGWSRQELVGQSVEQLIPERMRANHRGLRAAFMQASSKRTMGHGRELWALRQDGSETPVEVGLTAIETDDGRLVLCSVVDATARREAERALRDSEEQFRLVVEGLQDYALFLLDPDGRVRTWNAGAERIKQYSAGEIVGRQYEVFFPEEAIADGQPAAILEQAAVKGRWEGEALRQRKDGSKFLGHVVLTALRDGGQGLRGFVMMTRDVTEQRRLEEAIRNAQKVQAIGTLAGGIAHDFNNILTAIVGYTEMARGEASPNSSLDVDLDRVLTAAERGRELVQRILDFSRRQDVVRAPIRMDGAVQEALDLLRASLPSTIEFRTRFDLDLPAVLSDPMLVHQVVMNLCTNAAQAMTQGGGVLEVQLEQVQVGEVAARRIAELQPGRYIRLRVTDTGHGMPPEVLKRAFEPFFTTKPAGVGTGLGLSVVYGIVKQHGGAFDIRSAPGAGTTIDVYLPALGSSANAKAVRRHEVRRGHGEHILLVDDEEAIAVVSRRQLESLGYRVTPFTSSVAALAEFRRQPYTFDLVITDNTMPVLTGLAFAREVQSVRPDTPVLMVSGFGEGIDVDTIAQSGVRRLLPKPYSLHKLSEAVAQVLATRD
jgi:PAS domain S-box-containing protein